mgnify:FL=1|tara:strand:+ start:2925 stop:3260 length:336 start_codon:yes stop_codon:yes gene_type:complete
MKKYIYLLFVIFLSNAYAQDSPKKKKVSFKVSGNCEMCKMRIEKAALSVNGVKYANWSIPENQLRLIYNSNKVNIIEVHESVSNSGHDTSERKAPSEIYSELPLCCLYVRE